MVELVGYVIIATVMVYFAVSLGHRIGCAIGLYIRDRRQQ